MAIHSVIVAVFLNLALVPQVAHAGPWSYMREIYNTRFRGAPQRPDAGLLRNMQQPVEQGLHVRVTVTGLRNSLECTDKWTQLNHFDRAFDFNSQTLFDSDSKEHNFNLLVVSYVRHLGARTHTVIEDMLRWTVYDSLINVAPLRTLTVDQQGAHAVTRPEEWIAINGFAQDFQTVSPADAKGRFWIDLGTARNINHESQTVREGKLIMELELPYDLSAVGDATKDRESRAHRVMFEQSILTGNPCFRGYVDVRKSKLQWWQQ